MNRDSRLSGVLHVLLHMAQHPGPSTSDMLARVMGTNPVVIRRLMAGLRDRGHVRSRKGHGGGWVIACDLDTVTLRDIHDALGRPRLLGMGNRTEAPDCLVEQAVNAALGDVLDEAEALILRRFGEISLAALSAECRSRAAERGCSPSGEESHAR